LGTKFYIKPYKLKIFEDLMNGLYKSIITLGLAAYMSSSYGADNKSENTLLPKSLISSSSRLESIIKDKNFIVSRKDTLPDLTVTGMAIELETGDSCYFTPTLGIIVGLKNNSMIDSSSFDVQINDGTPTRILGGLRGNEYATLWVPGYEVSENSVYVDSLDEINESDETNNFLSQFLPIPTAPPSCTPLPITSTPTISYTPSITSTPLPTESYTPTQTPSPTGSFTPTVSYTPTLENTRTPTQTYDSDINEDGKVDAEDLMILLENWHKTLP